MGISQKWVNGLEKKKKTSPLHDISKYLLSAGSEFTRLFQRPSGKVSTFMEPVF